MPAFGSTLSASDIENVAAYVLDQAAGGWAG
jgi:mono/diheme cytochrome c family protein